MKDFKKYNMKKYIFMLVFSILFISVTVFISFKAFADNAIVSIDTYISIEDNTVEFKKIENNNYYLKFDKQTPKKAELYVYGISDTALEYPLRAYIGLESTDYWMSTASGNFVFLDDQAEFTFDRVAKYIVNTGLIADINDGLELIKGPYNIYSYDCSAENLDIIYDGNHHSIEVATGSKEDFPEEFKQLFFDKEGKDQGINTETNGVVYYTDLAPTIYYSEKDPRSIGFKDEDWVETNPSFSEVGLYNVYYKVEYKLFPKIDYTSNSKETSYEENVVFTGSASINIVEAKSSETENSSYRNAMSHAVSELLAPKEDYPYYDNIYLGSYANGSVSSGIKFRILDRSTNDNFFKSGFLLQSVNNLAISTFGQSSEITPNLYLKTMWYSHSYIKDYMQYAQNSIYNKAFTTLEKARILKTNKTDTTYRIKQEKSYADATQSTVSGISTIDALGSTLRDAYVFPLSAAECFNENYGFKHPQDSGISNLSADDGPINTQGNPVTDWWTRSAIYQRQSTLDPSGHYIIYKDTGANASFNYGPAYASSYLNLGDKDKVYGVRPSLNLDVSSVAFISSAGDTQKGTLGSKAVSVKEKFSQINDKYTGNDFKLTMYDDTLGIKFDVSKDAKYKDSEGEKRVTGDDPETKEVESPMLPELVVTNEHSEVTIPYTDAKLKRNSQDNLYISVLITEYESGTIKYYGRLEQVEKTKGELTIVLPPLLEKGKYKLQLFEEQYNGGTYDLTNLTDYCSKMDELIFTMYKELDYNIQTQSAAGAQIYNDTISVYYNGEYQSIDSYIQAIAPKDINGKEEASVEIKYKDGDINSGSTYKKDAPQYSDAGEYKITFKTCIADDADTEGLYYKSKENTMTFNILKRPYTFDIADEIQIPYNGQGNFPQINMGTLVGSSAVVVYSQTENDLDGIENYASIDETNKHLLIAPSYKDVKRNESGEVESYIVYYRILDKNNFYSYQKGFQKITITPKNITYSAAAVELDYDGGEHTVEVRPSDPSSEDTSITYTKYSKLTKNDGTTQEIAENNLLYPPTYSDVGEYKIGFTISTGDGNYNTTTGITTLKIKPSTIKYTVSDLRATYNGEYHPIDMQVNIAEKGTDSAGAATTDEQTAYTVKYYWDAAHTNEIKNASFKKVMDKTPVYYSITAKNYRETNGVVTVEIKPSTITYRMDDISNIIYDGDKHGISISATNVDDNASKITYSTDGQNYSLINPRYIDAGTYKVFYRIEAENYETVNGNIEFTIHPRLISAVYIEDIVGRVYNGEEIRPSIIAKDGEPNIITEDDYDIVYTDNIQPGTGTVSLIGKHNYTGKTTKHFIIYSQSSTGSMETPDLFTTSGGSLLSVPSFGLNFNAGEVSEVTADGGLDMIDFNAQQSEESTSDMQEQTDETSENQKDNTVKPKSIRDYVYIIIGVLIVLAAIATVVVLKLKSRKKNAQGQEDANDEISDEAEKSQDEVVDVDEI